MASSVIKSLRARLDHLTLAVDLHTASPLDALTPSQLSRYREWQASCDVVVAAAATELVEAGWTSLDAADLQYAAMLECEWSMPHAPADIADVLGFHVPADLTEQQVANRYVSELLR